MHSAPLSLLIVCQLLLFLAERVLGVTFWPLLAGIILASAAALLLSARLHRRDLEVLERLRRELAGMQQQAHDCSCRYKSLLEGAGNAIVVLDARTGVIEEANGMGVGLLAYTRQELGGMPGRELLDPVEYDRLELFLDRLRESGRAEIAGLQVKRKDGSRFLGEINATLIAMDDRQLVHCILRDVTEVTRTEKENWQRNRELSILNNILTGIKLGPELEGMHEGTLAEIMELFEAGGGTIHLVGEMGAPPEGCVSRHVSKYLEKLISSFIARTPGQFREVCVQREMAGECLLRNAALEGWYCLTSVPLTAGDRLVGVVHLMHASPRGYTPEELRFLATVGKQLGNMIEKSRLFAELSWKTSELLRSHRLLEKTSHNLSASEIKLKQNLALVEQAHLNLSRLDRMKTHFLGMVSHEFNTPLTSIISGSDFLLQEGGASEPEAAQVLRMVHDAGLRLKELVADLLKLIKMEARDDDLHTCAVHLKGFLEALTTQLRPQLDRKRQTVTLTGLDELPFFDGDSSYLERLFAELLLNAMKFSPEGGKIEVTGRVVDRELLWERKETLQRFNSSFLVRCGDRSYLEVEVRDQGVGVPVEEQQGIFELFYEVGDIRHHSSGSGRSHGKGAGLGLAMVKGMVEAHGGMVWVESKEGSSFFLLLPLEQEASQAALF